MYVDRTGYRFVHWIIMIHYFIREIQSNTFKGSKGRVDWRERSWSSDSVYANLSDYYIDVRESQFKADSVEFFNKTLFNFPIIGQFSNKIVSGSAKENFPVFKSYKKNIIMEDFLLRIFSQWVQYATIFLQEKTKELR